MSLDTTPTRKSRLVLGCIFSPSCIVCAAAPVRKGPVRFFLGPCRCSGRAFAEPAHAGTGAAPPTYGCVRVRVRAHSTPPAPLRGCGAPMYGCVRVRARTGAGDRRVRRHACTRIHPYHPQVALLSPLPASPLPVGCFLRLSGWMADLLKRKVAAGPGQASVLQFFTIPVQKWVREFDVSK